MEYLDTLELHWGTKVKTKWFTQHILGKKWWIKNLNIYFWPHLRFHWARWQVFLDKCEKRAALQMKTWPTTLPAMGA